MNTQMTEGGGNKSGACEAHRACGSSRRCAPRWTCRWRKRVRGGATPGGASPGATWLPSRRATAGCSQPRPAGKRACVSSWTLRVHKRRRRTRTHERCAEAEAHGAQHASAGCGAESSEGDTLHALRERRGDTARQSECETQQSSAAQRKRCWRCTARIERRGRRFGGRGATNQLRSENATPPPGSEQTPGGAARAGRLRCVYVRWRVARRRHCQPPPAVAAAPATPPATPQKGRQSDGERPAAQRQPRRW